MKIAVDCDLTVVNTGQCWLEWLNKVTRGPKVDLTGVTNIPYNLSEFFPELQEHVDPFDFWRNKYLYYGMEPIIGSQSVLEWAHEQGHKIIFVSSVTGQHGSSKYYWLKEHFPFLDGVVFTREKWAVGCDVLIDDRNEFLNQMGNVFKIRFDTPYTQREEQDSTTFLAKDWVEVGNLLEQMAKTLEGK